MGIKKKLKRLFYRVWNSDPVRSCPVFQNKGCLMIDDPYCNVSDCRIIDKCMGEKWVGCAICAYQDACCSKHFGLGCCDGRVLEEEKEETV